TLACSVRSATVSWSLVRSRTMRTLRIYLLLALFTIAPIVIAAIAYSVASACGCRLSEARVYPCFVHGVDVGEWVNNTYLMAGCLGVLTVPVGLISMLGFTISLATRKNR